ncbi:uncharacterized protein B0H18DRAFT_978613 [Fomitopsis serialis]|uniref:uncharacterized protein n=1 Tax=Fomitopsis serialis TaxID=139415 RepID=UPI0020078281|nr:uncharacterized protein B0H18DRAFT_978613 [Neoantrodia serialis]KAH9934849.1 hypothetical protein B0H18DRAFT_978613 [Neoantrodia serialis]
MTSPSSDKSCTYRSAREHAYVVLAACDQHQIAHEVRDADGKLRGAFTLALFRALRDSEDGRKSYHTIISNLKLVRPSVTGQQPECRGMDRFKRAFMHYAVHEDLSSNSQEMENGRLGARRQRLPESTPALPRLRRLQTSDAHMRLPISESMAAVK